MALSRAARSEPSWERTCSETEMDECGKRWVWRFEARARAIVISISCTRLADDVAVSTNLYQGTVPNNVLVVAPSLLAIDAGEAGNDDVDID